MAFNLVSIETWLSSPTGSGVKLWVLIVICVFLLLILILTFICQLYCHRRKRNRNCQSEDRETAISGEVSTEIDEKKGSDDQFSRQGSVNIDQYSICTDWEYSAGRYSIAAVKDGHRRSTFALDEIELATDGFSAKNVISIEDYNVDYFGILADDTKVIVKIFNANNRYVLNLINSTYLLIHFIVI